MTIELDARTAGELPSPASVWSRMAGALRRSEDWVLAESRRATRGQKETVAVLVALGILVTGWGGREGVPALSAPVVGTAPLGSREPAVTAPPATPSAPSAPMPELAPPVLTPYPEAPPFDSGPATPPPSEPAPQEPSSDAPQEPAPSEPLPLPLPLPLPIG